VTAWASGDKQLVAGAGRPPVARPARPGGPMLGQDSLRRPTPYDRVQPNPDKRTAPVAEQLAGGGDRTRTTLGESRDFKSPQDVVKCL
jgi:hypothetical protein